MATARPADLPDFDDPPVVEVALSVQFTPLAQFRTVHVGGLWERFRNRFKTFREQPPIEPVFETFGAQRASGQITLELRSGPPIPRLWFINEDETQLVQFQNDRFIHNWRKVGDAVNYPRYESIKEEFIGEIGELSNFLQEQSVGEIVPNQCEITYINHIRSGRNEDLREDLGRVLRVVSPMTSLSAGPLAFEDARMSMRFVISSDENKPIGRLIVNAEPARDRDGTPIIVLTLIARGNPVEPTLEKAFDFLDLGRDKIVRGFALLTTDEMHKRWKRKQ